MFDIVIVNDDLERAVGELATLVRGLFDARSFPTEAIDRTPRRRAVGAGASPYALVIIAAKRARQINAYHHQLGEGEFDDERAAARRVPVEELPHHGARGGCRRQDGVQVRQ